MKMNEDLKHFRQRFKKLQDEANTWMGTWQDLSDYAQPRRGRYLNQNVGTAKQGSETNDGRKKHDRIINGSASDALRVISAGLHGGLTSPSRPWFNLGLEDKELQSFGPVKEWLQDVRDRILETLSISNLYSCLHNGYYELALFGTNAMLIEEDFATVVRGRPFTIGEYYLALDHRYRPEALYRQFDMTAAQMVAKFGRDKVSQSVLTAVDNDNRDEWFPVCHALERNPKVNPDTVSVKGMAFISKYWQHDSKTDMPFLREGGYRTIPFLAPRWFVNGVDVYGWSPGMEALGDMKMLQKMEEKKLKALDKLVDPPMNAPASMKQQGGTIISGGVNYIDPGQSQQTFAPAFQINPDIRSMAFEIDNVQNRIKRFFFNDLFLALLGNDKTMTATEVAKRHEEKLIMLGPVTERLQTEIHDPLIERVYSIMEDRNLIPPAPKELQGKDLKIEYISMLAQAQKLVSTDTINKFASFIGGIAQISPSVVDKFDADKAADEYAEVTGVNPKLVRSEVEVAQIRQQRAEQEQQLKQQAVLQNLSGVAKDLGSIEMDKNTALDKANELVTGRR